MSSESIETVANAMVADGKGILAIDESSPTIKKRFDSIGAECSEENRRAYRELLIGGEGINEFISGMILYDETIRQSAADGTPFPQLLASRGIMPGIKVDGGAKDLAGHSGEKVTEGLDGLRDRLAEYRELGAPFAKWRAVITIGGGIPSRGCISANAHALARYAALCQEAGIVPMVEPEVLLEGDHSIERCYEVTEATLRAVFGALYDQRVVLEGTILKASMVLSGNRAAKRAGVEEVAERTLACLTNSVPAALPGVVFLSGGQTPVEATAHLNAMNAMASTLPWKLSFSYSRALQEPALKTWNGDAANGKAAQAALYHRAKLNSAASLGRYSESMEKAA
ncbi:MAG: fructose-bisphosphate aldolase class I [Gammaproteobacteria bacterium]|nr:fructose-bisphosphate aldolase class I [Gammaproteobacteria bacterium]NIM74806.1 fructose-bisphosphate aldolase class I [Gammaproteobacteria bacterium]NIN39237.1 fructose-bisphosphate aldolase class I [Gammaproteobacteria bacterium]NIO26723.1 fructose-bisphosphate aldolase class I [Gammaproteobacteria bacterium]NIO67279.1 fructose-bisphosphate aldolase class I [Gammaproteobacteria bacterium]